MGELPLNLGYICSKPGICKAITVVVGLIAACVILSGWNNAAGYTVEYITVGGNRFPVTLNGYFHPQYTDEKGNPITGEDHCVRYETDEKYVGEPVKNCPRNWMVLLPVSIIWIAFLGSAVVLLVLLIITLNKNALFNMLDMYGHFAAGFLNLVAAILVVVYVAFAFEKAGCNKERAPKDCAESREKSFFVSYFIAAGVFAIINAVVYVFTGLAVGKSKS